MITCKKATELISKSMDEPLSLKEELALKIHLFVCEFCERFKHQLSTIRIALVGNLGPDSGHEASSASDTCTALKAKKDRLKQKLIDL